MKSVITCLTLLAAATTAQAEVVTYDFTGFTNVGGQTRQFTGVFEFENSIPSHTVFYNGSNGPLQQGFRSSYFSSVRKLSITLQNGEAVSTASGGYIDVNNIQQAEPGSQVPAGLTVQAYAGPASGTINGITISTLYLAFLPQTSNFSWDDLDSYFGGNAETLLQNNPGLLPASIDPSLTGTTLSPSIEWLASSLFLGSIHSSPQGVTTTVNSITSFELRPVPSPSAAVILALAGASRVRRRRLQS